MRPSSSVAAPVAPSVSNSFQLRDDQIVHLKVMRLCKPRLSFESESSLHPSIPFDENQWNLYNESLSDELGIILIGDSSGRLFVGEEFSALFSFQNMGKFPVRSLSAHVVVELPSGGRMVLLDSNSFIPRDVPAENAASSLVTVPLSQAGEYIMRATITFGDSYGVARRVERAFKFSAEDALRFSTRINLLQDHIFLSVIVDNVSGQELFLRSVEFQPSNDFRVKESEKELPRGLIRSNESRIYVYELDFVDSDSYLSGGNVSLGGFSVEWRSNFADVGRFVVSPILFSVPPRSAFSLELKSIEFGEASESLPTYTAEEGVEKSAKVYIDEAFRVRLLLRSRYPREEHLVIRKNDTSFPSIRCVGSGAADLGRIPSGGEAEFTLDMICVASGIHAIEGIEVLCLDESRSMKLPACAWLLAVTR